MTWLKALLVAGALLCACASWAEEPVSGGPETLNLQQLMDRIERIDRALADLTGQMKSAASSSTRRQIQNQIRELQAEQEQLLLALEEKMGPLPPAVRSEKPIPLEQGLKSQERRHETVLDTNAERRLQ